MVNAIIPLDNNTLQRYIEHHHIEARIILVDEETPTVADAARALGVKINAIIKSLIFIADDEPLLVIAAGEAKISQKRLRDVLAVSRRKLRMVTADEALDITGFVVGSMPPFGHKQSLPTYIDSLSVPREGSILYGGGGTRSAMMELRAEELFAHLNDSAYLPVHLPLSR